MARIKNVVSSMRQEGVSIDFQAAREVVAGRRATNIAEEEALRFADAYRRIHDTPQEGLPELSIKSICHLHGRLYQDRDPDRYNPGNLKDAQNGIGPEGGAWIFECTPPERTEAELEALFAWFDAHRDHDSTVAVASTFFAEFQAIHPFHDGNGRLGRLLNVQILKMLDLENIGLVPLDARFFKSGEVFYEKLRSTNQHRTWQAWGAYYAKELRKAYESAVKMSDLQPLLDGLPTDSAKHVLSWALGGGGGWFKRGDIDPGGYQENTLSVALRQLVDRDLIQRDGKTKGSKYRIRTDLLEDIFQGIH